MQESATDPLEGLQFVRLIDDLTRYLSENTDARGETGNQLNTNSTLQHMLKG